MKRKRILFNLDVETLKEFKVLSARSELPMNSIVQDLIKRAIKVEKYKLS